MNEEIQYQLGLLVIYRRNLATYLTQAAEYGSTIPLHITNGIRKERQNIASVKKNLWEYYSYKVKSEPNDIDDKTTITLQVPADHVILVMPKNVAYELYKTFDIIPYFVKET